jgi:hypothetical protein
MNRDIFYITEELHTPAAPEDPRATVALARLYIRRYATYSNKLRQGCSSGRAHPIMLAFC